MLEVNYSKLFRDAHKEAREIVSEIGVYKIAFKIALIDQWKIIKKTKLSDKQIEALENDGWARWTKGNFDRLYFNADKNGVLDVDYYKSGNISYAEWDGEEISHSKAYRIMDIKCYIDVNNAKVNVKSWDSNDDETDMLQDAAQNSLDKVIA